MTDDNGICCSDKQAFRLENSIPRPGGTTVALRKPTPHVAHAAFVAVKQTAVNHCSGI